MTARTRSIPAALFRAIAPGSRTIASAIRGRVMDVTPEARIARECNAIRDDSCNTPVLGFGHLEPGDLTTVAQCAK